MPSPPPPPPPPLGKRPVLRDHFLSEAPTLSPADWGTNDMSGHVQSFMTDKCNPNKLIGDASGCGRVLMGPNEPTIWIADGAGLDHSPSPFDQRMEDAAVNGGTTFLRPYDAATFDKPVFALGSNTVLKCFGLYPSVPDNCAGLTFTYGADSATIGGRIVEYAPFIVGHFKKNSDGSSSTKGRDLGFITLDVQVNGATSIAYLHEPMLNDVEAQTVAPNGTVGTWATDYTSQNGRTSGGHFLRIRGQPMLRGLMLGRCSISCDVELDIGAHNWSAAENASHDQQKISQYAQLKCKALHMKGHSTGGNIKGRVRNCECGVFLEAGKAPADWTTNVIVPPLHSYPASDAPDSGKYVSLGIDLVFEFTPTAVRINSNAFLATSRLNLAGNFLQRHWAQCIQPVVDDQSVADAGGSLEYHAAKVGVAAHSDWTPSSYFNGSNGVVLTSAIQSGPMFKAVEAAVGRHWNFMGGKSAHWCAGAAVGAKVFNVQYDIKNHMTVSFLGTIFSAGLNTASTGGDYLFSINVNDYSSGQEQEAIDSLDLHGIKYLGFSAPGAGNYGHIAQIAQRPSGTGAYMPAGFAPNGSYHPNAESRETPYGTWETGQLFIVDTSEEV